MCMNKADESQQTVTIIFEGEPLQVPAGISVAAAVIGPGRAGHTGINPVTGEQRAPNCLMGVCFECVMEIDGKRNQQSCLVTVQEGMQVKRQLSLQEQF